ncbi:hypothetical protein N8076_01810 [Gammaproteobacteria bacterium]|nr:hypothetical protein [Gammaproteobacteria bacterium]
MSRFLLKILMTNVAAGIIFQNGNILVTRRGPGEKPLLRATLVTLINNLYQRL